MSRWLVVILVTVAAGIVGSLPLRRPLAARDTSEEILVRLAADGRVTVWVGPDSHHMREVVPTSARFGDGDAETTQATIAAMQPVLDELAGRSERDEYGVSRARMRIEAAPRARWQWLLWLLQLGVVPTTDISQYALSTRGAEETLELQLPRDGQLESPPLLHDLYVRFARPPAGGRDALRLRLEVLDRSGIVCFVSSGASPNPKTVAGPLTVALDAHGTPDGLEPLVAATRLVRARDPREGDLWLLVAPWFDRTTRGVTARTLLDIFGALQQVEGLRVEFGQASLPLDLDQPGGR